MRYKISRVLPVFFLLCVLLLQGCAFTSAGKEQTITHNIWHVYGAQTDSPLNDFIRTFNETVGKEQGIQVKPTVVGYTRNDLEMWLDNVARIACMGGASPEDVAQISFGYGTFTGALGLHGGLEKIGASVIPMSSGNTNKQIMFLQDMGVTLLVATPSYALHLGEEIRNRGIDPSKDL